MTRTQDTNSAPLVLKAFAPLKDPRQAKKVRHALSTILLVVFGAVLSGVEDWDGMAAWAEDHHAWLRRHSPCGDELPSADTLRRVFERLDPRAFTRCFEAWTRALAGSLRGAHLAVDGKSVAGAADPEQPTVPLYFLHVWAVGQRLLLAARPIEGAPAESRTLQQVLPLLDIEGAVLTGDANLTTAANTEAIVAGKGSYVLALKGNRGPQHEEVRSWFERTLAGRTRGVALSARPRVERGHGRSERRVAYAAPAKYFPRTAALFAGLRSVLRIERTRETSWGISREVHYYVSNLPAHQVRLAGYVRAHWGVENDLHRSLDVVLHEDACPVPKGNAAQNLAVVRRVALAQLHRDASVRRSLVNKRRKADRNDDYREHLLALGNT